jgi:hypothetical protein
LPASVVLVDTFHLAYPMELACRDTYNRSKSRAIVTTAAWFPLRMKVNDINPLQIHQLYTSRLPS